VDGLNSRVYYLVPRYTWAFEFRNINSFKFQDYYLEGIYCPSATKDKYNTPTGTSNLNLIQKDPLLEVPMIMMS
jgi:hypothetical protein